MSDLGSVLLIEDDPHTSAIFELLMQHHNLEFFVAHDSTAALQYIGQHKPDVIVIDLFLPGLDGFQTLKVLRQRADLSNCRILATTAYYTQDTPSEVMDWGFDGYVPKPFVPDTFLTYLCGE